MPSLTKFSVYVSRRLFCFTNHCSHTITPSSCLLQKLNLHYRFYSKNNKSEENDKTKLQNDKNNESQVENNENDDIEMGLNYGKYKVFRDTDSPVVLDVEEERLLLQENEVESSTSIQAEFDGINLNRGITGVYDIEDLVDVLRRENAQDIFVATLPKTAKYVDYIVVVTGKSRRHMIGLAEFIRKLYKKKRLHSDRIPRIEGEGSSDWIALDLGNIALHIFSRDARSVYDLESLWSLGADYDLHINAAEDPLITLLQKHKILLDDLKPADSLR